MRKLVSMTIVLMMCALHTFAQEKTVTGKVTDQKDGSPLPGVSVTVKGTSVGTVTGSDGSFSLNVPSTAKTLVISFVNYQSVEMALSNRSVFNVSLSTLDQSLQEVVVVGYGTARKKNLVGSVSQIGNKEITNIPIASIDQILQGKAPGVQITAVNGRPGANAYVKIRGTGSINAGSGPLYVIDGVPAPDGNALNTLNPNDIENISVLKDASSAAIYGSRASNGAILITTKKGRANKPQFTIRSNYAVKSKTPDNYDMMNTRQKIQWEYNVGKDGIGAFLGSGNRGNNYAQTAMSQLVTSGALPAGTNNLYSLTQAQLDLVIGQVIAVNGDNNWQDILLRDAPVWTNELSLSGGSEKLRYFFSLQDYNEEGIGLRSKFRRTGGTLNVEYKATDWLKIGNNLRANVTNDRLLRDRYNAQSPFYAMYAYNPYEPPRIPGTSNYNLTGFFAGFPILEAIENNVEDSYNVIGFNNMFVELNLIKNLTLKSNLGINYNNFERESFIKPGSFLDQVVGDPAAPGSKVDNGNRNFNYVWTNTATYDRSFGNHNLRVLGGSEFSKNKFKSWSISSKGYASPNITTQNASAANTAWSTGRSDWSLFSLFANGEYNYDSRYFLSSSFRRDGSSRFTDALKFANFWSVGAGWDIAAEKFMSNQNLFNVLKLRAAVGTTGNFSIGDYNYQELYGVNSYADLLATFPSQVKNDSLSWEKSISQNIGLDAELLNRRLTVSLDYYTRKTKDLLLSVPSSATNGFGGRLENVGEIENKGIEASVSYDVISKKNFTWTLRVNGTLNKNRVTSLPDGKDIPTTLTRLSVGKPFYNFYLVRWAGVNPTTGAAQYLDKDGKVTATYNGNDAVFLDNKAPDPRWYGTIGTDVSWKNLSLTMDVYYSGGNYIYNYQERDRLNVFANRGYNMDMRAYDYWKTAGQVATLPRPTSAWNPGSQVTDQFLQKGDFVRLRNLQLAYSLSNDFTKKYKVQNIRFYVSGQNLFTITKYKGDPEVGLGNGESFNVVPGLGQLYSYPAVRTMSAGLEIVF